MRQEFAKKTLEALKYHTDYLSHVDKYDVAQEFEGVNSKTV